MRFSLTTNGTLLDSRVARSLARDGIPVLVSLDGDERAHDTHRRTPTGKGTFAKVLEGIQVLKREQAQIGVRMTVTPSTVGAVADNVQMLAGRGVSYFIVGAASGEQWTLESGSQLAESRLQVFEWWRRLNPASRPRFSFLESVFGAKRRSALHRWGCRAGRSGICISPEGEIFPCAKVLGANNGRGILRLGNVSEGFVELDTRRKLCGLRPSDRLACWNCAWQCRCYGGCYAVNYRATGDPFCPDPVECLTKGLQERVNDRIRQSSLRGRTTVAVDMGFVPVLNGNGCWNGLE